MDYKKDVMGFGVSMGAMNAVGYEKSPEDLRQQSKKPKRESSFKFEPDEDEDKSLNPTIQRSFKSSSNLLGSNNFYGRSNHNYPWRMSPAPSSSSASYTNNSGSIGRGAITEQRILGSPMIQTGVTASGSKRDAMNTVMNDLFPQKKTINSESTQTIAKKPISITRQSADNAQTTSGSKNLPSKLNNSASNNNSYSNSNSNSSANCDGSSINKISQIYSPESSASSWMKRSDNNSYGSNNKMYGNMRSKRSEDWSDIPIRQVNSSSDGDNAKIVKNNSNFDVQQRKFNDVSRLEYCSPSSKNINNNNSSSSNSNSNSNNNSNSRVRSWSEGNSLKKLGENSSKIKNKSVPEVIDLMDDNDDDNDVMFVDTNENLKLTSSLVASSECLRRSSRSRNRLVYLGESTPVILVYPMEEEDMDCITIHESDTSRLDKYMYLNDSLIDLQIKLDIAESAIKDRVHAFNCLFIPKLTEQKKDNFSLVARWTKKVDLWSKDFVFVPINEDNHWSLIVVVRPGLCISPDTNKINNDYPCFLIMDSLGMHDPIKFTKIIKSYLVDEYMSRLTAGGITKLAPDEIEEISRRIHAIKYVKVQIPRQHNGYDCGVYVIKYLKYVLDVQPTSRHEDISTNFKDYFDGNHFNQDDIDAKREEMRKTISNLSNTWKELIKERKQKRIEEKKEEKVRKGDLAISEENSDDDSISDIDNNNILDKDVSISTSNHEVDPIVEN